MPDKKNPAEDDFWDLSAYVPPQKPHTPSGKSVDTVEIRFSHGSQPTPSDRGEQKLTFSAPVVKREIPANARSTGEAFEDETQSYTLSSSMIRRVTLKKWKVSYRYYDAFRQDALANRETCGRECAYVPFFSYVPQYDQMNEEQRNYYFFWRQNVRQGNFLPVDYSYLLLYVFELINIGGEDDPAQAQYLLTALWNRYHEKFPAISGKLAAWICDFSLIHRLPPAENAGSALVRAENTLREFYIRLPDGESEACARSLLKYCSAYDYRTSKFATGERLPLFDLHIFKALQYVIARYAGSEQFLAAFTDGESHMERDAYAGALCCSEEKYRIGIDYYSLSRTNELRYHIGDIVKYAENKLRAYLGIKSRLTVYSLSAEIRGAIDGYFATLTPPAKPKAAKEVRLPYEALYDLPAKRFSMEDALRIENESWQTTDELISAFGDVQDEAPEEPEEDTAAEEIWQKEPASEVVSDGERSLAVALGGYLAAARAIRDGDTAGFSAAAEALGRMPESIVDAINDIAIEETGDILIEEDGDGWCIPEDYRPLLGE